MDQARLRKNLHNKNSHNWHVSETRDTKSKLVKILLFTYPDVKSVEIQPKLFLKATIKKFTILQWPTILSWTARTEAKVT